MRSFYPIYGFRGWQGLPPIAITVAVTGSVCWLGLLLFSRPVWANEPIVLAPLTALVAAAPRAAPMTLRQAQRLASARSQQLLAHDALTKANQDLAIAAGQRPDPLIKFGIDNLPANGADRFSLTRDFMTMRRIGVMQEFTRSDKLRLRADGFERNAEKAQAEKTATLAAIERDTAVAWFELFYLEKMAAVIAEQGQQATLETQAADGAYRAGRGSQAEVFSARSAIANFDDRASEIARRVQNAKIWLARWTGTEPDQRLAEEPNTEVIGLAPATLAQRLSQHPLVLVASRQLEIAENQAQLAQANKQSDWTLEVAYQARGPAFSDMLSIGVSIPFQSNQANQQDRQLAAKLALVEQARAEREELLREQIAQTRVMLGEWQNQRERSARFERELIPLAKQRTLASLSAYRGGKAPLSEVLAGRRNEIEVRIQALQLQTDTARLWAQLNFIFPDADTAAQPTISTSNSNSNHNIKDAQ